MNIDHITRCEQWNQQLLLGTILLFVRKTVTQPPTRVQTEKSKRILGKLFRNTCNFEILYSKTTPHLRPQKVDAQSNHKLDTKPANMTNDALTESKGSESKLFSGRTDRWYFRFRQRMEQEGHMEAGMEPWDELARQPNLERYMTQQERVR